MLLKKNNKSQSSSSSSQFCLAASQMSCGLRLCSHFLQQLTHLKANDGNPIWIGMAMHWPETSPAGILARSAGTHCSSNQRILIGRTASTCNKAQWTALEDQHLSIIALCKYPSISFNHSQCQIMVFLYSETKARYVPPRGDPDACSSLRIE